MTERSELLAALSAALAATGAAGASSSGAGVGAPQPPPPLHPAEAQPPGAFYELGGVTPSLFPPLTATSGGRSPTTLSRLVDPVLAPLDMDLLGVPGTEPLATSLIFKRQVGWSSIRHAYTPSAAQLAAYTEALKEEACSVEEGLAALNVSILGRATSAAAAAAVIKEVRHFEGNVTNSMWGSSIFVRADEANMCALKAAITGADNTPYANGFFTFDIFCGEKFPAEPPHVCVEELFFESPCWRPTVSILTPPLLSLPSPAVS